MTGLQHSLFHPRLLLIGLKALCIWISCSQILLATSPQGAETAKEHADRGLELAQKGDLKKAESELRLAVELVPDDPTSLSSPLTNDKAEEALPHFEAAARLNRKSSKIHFALTRAYRRLGRAEAASKETRIYETLKAEESKSDSELPSEVSGPTNGANGHQ